MEVIEQKRVRTERVVEKDARACKDRNPLEKRRAVDGRRMTVVKGREGKGNLDNGVACHRGLI